MSASSSSPSLTASNSIPTSSPNGGNNGGGGGPGGPGGASSSLYLFTFLATLLLLLAVSCAIVMRSFVLRRRFRRRVEEALAAGIILPQQHSRKRDFGEKPHLWDTWLAPSNNSWENIMPVSAKILSEKYTGAGKVRKTSKESMASPNSSTLTRTRSAFRHVLRYVRPRPPSRPSAPSRTESDSSVDPAPSAIPTIGDTSLEDARLQVSVLIAMPNPYRPHGSETVTKGKARGYDVDGEDEVPDVMFGIAELPWKVRSTESN